MELERDPNMRRRLDGQELLDRDQQVATLREQGVPFRVIAARLGCSLGSVQKAVRRAHARRAERVLAASADDYDEPVGSVRLVGVDELNEFDDLFTDERGKRFNLFTYKDQPHTLQFRAESFNVTNSVRFDVYGVNLNILNPARFGQYTNTLTKPRVFQFSLRYEF